MTTRHFFFSVWCSACPDNGGFIETHPCVSTRIFWAHASHEQQFVDSFFGSGLLALGHIQRCFFVSSVDMYTEGCGFCSSSSITNTQASCEQQFVGYSGFSLLGSKGAVSILLFVHAEHCDPSDGDTAFMLIPLNSEGTKRIRDQQIVHWDATNFGCSLERSVVPRLETPSYN